MSVRLKLVAIIVSVAVLPLIVATTTALGIHRRAHDEKIRELHRRGAEAGALSSRRYLDHAIAGFRLLAGSTIRWDELNEAEREGALWVVYRQLDEIAAATLLDGSGSGLATVYMADPESVPDLAAHPVASTALLEAFGRSIPFQEALARGVATGAPFVPPGGGPPVLPIALKVEGARGSSPGEDDRSPKGEDRPDGPGQPWVVVVALSLREVCVDVVRSRADETEAFLLDASRRVLCGSRDDLEVPQEIALLALPEGGAAGLTRYSDRNGRDLLAAVAPTALDWRVVVQQPADVAFAASRRIGVQSAIWTLTGLVIALVAGLLLSRSISRPIARLVQGSLEMGRGNLAYRLDVRGRDEIARLSGSFNEMAGQIQRRDAEIREWNAELQKRVEERTRELREAQDQILQASKISAVSALAAGMAHEVNNPLASVVGIGQILKSRAAKSGDAKQAELLERHEKEALRIKEIVRDLLSLAETAAGGERALMDVSDVFDGASKLVKDRFAERGIEIVRSSEGDSPMILGNHDRLREVVLQLLNNAYNAMKDGGRVTISTSVVGGKLVRVQVADTGKGIPPENLDKVFEPFFTTKDDWNSKGLGLSVAYGIIKEHGGTIKLASTVGEGTTVTLTFPLAKKGSMLV